MLKRCFCGIRTNEAKWNQNQAPEGVIAEEMRKKNRNCANKRSGQKFFGKFCKFA